MHARRARARAISHNSISRVVRARSKGQYSGARAAALSGRGRQNVKGGIRGGAGACCQLWAESRVSYGGSVCSKSLLEGAAAAGAMCWLAACKWVARATRRWKNKCRRFTQSSFHCSCYLQKPTHSTASLSLVIFARPSAWQLIYEAHCCAGTTGVARGWRVGGRPRPQPPPAAGCGCGSGGGRLWEGAHSCALTTVDHRGSALAGARWVRVEARCLACRLLRPALNLACGACVGLRRVSVCRCVQWRAPSMYVSVEASVFGLQALNQPPS